MISENSLKILCVDDEPAQLEVLRADIEEHLYAHVVVARDGTDAFKKARNQEFDIIVTDYRMPRLNGNDLITALRETSMNIKTPILIYTSYADDVLKELNPSYKLIDILEKPADPEEIASTIKNLKKGISNISRFKRPKSQQKADANFLNSFIDATTYTLKHMTEMQYIEHRDPYIFEDHNLGVEISANISMNSELFAGILGISLSEPVFLKIASDIIGEKQVEIHSENRDAAGELINIIYGQTKLRLSELGFSLGKAIPSIVVGKNHQVYASSRVKTLVVPFNCDHGLFYICISLTHSINQKKSEDSFS